MGFSVHEQNESEVETRRLLLFMNQLLLRIKDVAVLEKIFGDGGYDIKEFFVFLKKPGTKCSVRIDKPTIDFIKRQHGYNKNKLGMPYYQWKPERTKGKRKC